MENEFGHKFNYAEQSGGFIEQVLEVIGESAQLMVIGFNPDGDNPVKVSSNMERETALQIINSLQGALEVVVDWKKKKAKIRVRDLFSGKTDVRQYLTVDYHDYDQDHEHPIMFVAGDRMDEVIEIEVAE